MKLYDLLKIKSTATRLEITNAYSELAYAYRQKKISPEEFDEIHWAFKTLNNTQLRNFYDSFGDSVLSTVLSQTCNFIISAYFTPENILLGKIILIFLLPIFIFSPVIFNFLKNIFFLPLSVFLALSLVFFESVKISLAIKNHMQIFYYRKKIFFYNLFLLMLLIFLFVFSLDLFFQKFTIFLFSLFLLYECINLYYKFSSYQFKKNNYHIPLGREYVDYFYMALSTVARIMLYMALMGGYEGQKYFLGANIFLLFFNKKMTNCLFLYIVIFLCSVFLPWYYYVNIGFANTLLFICGFLTGLNYTIIFLKYPNVF